MTEATAEVTLKDFASPNRPTWCPGCGDFGILNALKRSFVEDQLAPHEVMIVSGIGCGSKITDYIRANGFMTIHGRPLPVATGVKLANPELKVLVISGDGDSYGIGGNHFLHTSRRNIDITHIVENNQIYALTKGQYSPTSDQGFVTTTSPDGAPEKPMVPTAVAFTAGATFIARTYAGSPRDMVRIFRAAMAHRGYALVDVLQPCVTFNKVNTYDWYEEMSYDAEAEAGYDASDREQAARRVARWDDGIPLGILYRKEGEPTYEERVDAMAAGPAAARPLDDLDEATFEDLKEAFA